MADNERRRRSKGIEVPKYIMLLTGPEYAPKEEQVTQAMLQKYRPEYNRGEGRVWLTADINKAIRFKDLNEMIRCVSQVPACKPLLPSGLPNKPIYCFQIQYMIMEDN